MIFIKLLISSEISGGTRELLEKRNIEIINLSPCAGLPVPIRGHIDMLVFKYNNRLYVWEEYYKQNKCAFDSLKTNIKICKTKIGNQYPFDIPYNVFTDSKNNIYSNTPYTAKEILSSAQNVISVKQGYAACSVCKVGKNGYITADNGLYSEIKSHGGNVLKISSGGIYLKGYDYGFIGGSSVKLSDFETLFFGNIESHPDFENIVEFANENGCRLIYDKKEKLSDKGGGITV